MNMMLPAVKKAAHYQEEEGEASTVSGEQVSRGATSTTGARAEGTSATSVAGDLKGQRKHPREIQLVLNNREPVYRVDREAGGTIITLQDRGPESHLVFLGIEVDTEDRVCDLSVAKVADVKSKIEAS
ncbi:hypothetical protein NDU88_006906 [Pleurodeles waltl]|uniref:Uncharacterized protein n=1 Tax=Pleurodeles waltl TaxID=8319 RepID=A0AAV7QJ34_PLEWA|nr:hypothetical protein NDU88_006906 [Pleurodeles waltl]